jgi:AraC-like DNA-binding protein
MPAYRELPAPLGLERQVACIWESGGTAARVLPDACVDIVWSQGRLIVAGPATLPVLAPATPGQSRCGVRFRVGLAGAALGLPASELRDESVPLAELWGAEGRRLEARLAAADAPLDALVTGVAERIAGAREDVVRDAVLRVRAGEGGVAGIAREAALSERQLLRRFERAVGYGPRTLRRVLRLQRFLALARTGGSLARLAADAGYADQAHLTRDCGALTGLPPAALLAEGAGPAGEPVGQASDGAPWLAPARRTRPERW